MPLASESLPTGEAVGAAAIRLQHQTKLDADVHEVGLRSQAMRSTMGQNKELSFRHVQSKNRLQVAACTTNMAYACRALPSKLAPAKSESTLIRTKSGVRCWW